MSSMEPSIQFSRMLIEQNADAVLFTFFKNAGTTVQ